VGRLLFTRQCATGPMLDAGQQRRSLGRGVDGQSEVQVKIVVVVHVTLAAVSLGGRKTDRREHSVTLQSLSLGMISDGK
jgi:hypothetical protein